MPINRSIMPNLPPQNGRIQIILWKKNCKNYRKLYFTWNLFKIYPWTNRSTASFRIENSVAISINKKYNQTFIYIEMSTLFSIYGKKFETFLSV